MTKHFILIWGGMIVIIPSLIIYNYLSKIGWTSVYVESITSNSNLMLLMFFSTILTITYFITSWIPSLILLSLPKLPITCNLQVIFFTYCASLLCYISLISIANKEFICVFLLLIAIIIFYTFFITLKSKKFKTRTLILVTLLISIVFMVIPIAFTHTILGTDFSEISTISIVYISTISYFPAFMLTLRSQVIKEKSILQNSKNKTKLSRKDIDTISIFAVLFITMSLTLNNSYNFPEKLLITIGVSSKEASYYQLLNEQLIPSIELSGLSKENELQFKETLIFKAYNLFKFGKIHLLCTHLSTKDGGCIPFNIDDVQQIHIQKNKNKGTI